MRDEPLRDTTMISVISKTMTAIQDVPIITEICFVEKRGWHRGPRGSVEPVACRSADFSDGDSGVNEKNLNSRRRDRLASSRVFDRATEIAFLNHGNHSSSNA